MEELDYYALLGVEPDADQEQLKVAYRARARACHPDRFATLDADVRRRAEARMALLNEAYGVLSRPDRRRRYDRRRRATATDGSRDVDRRRRSGNGGTVEDAELVVRAAVEEFEDRLSSWAKSPDGWTRTEVEEVDASLELRSGRHRARALFFARPRLDSEGLRQQLRRIQGHARELRGSWWERTVVVGFSAAIEFDERPHQVRILRAFNRKSGDRVGFVALLDLMTWKPADDDAEIHRRLRDTLP